MYAFRVVKFIQCRKYYWVKDKNRVVPSTD